MQLQMDRYNCLRKCDVPKVTLLPPLSPFVGNSSLGQREKIKAVNFISSQKLTESKNFRPLR